MVEILRSATVRETETKLEEGMTKEIDGKKMKVVAKIKSLDIATENEDRQTVRTALKPIFQQEA